MRNLFLNKLLNYASSDPKIILIVGDLGYSVIEEFQASLPEQFINIGVAEQNMVGVAAGMASENNKVFTYSIANFPTFRCAEQIRNDVVYHGYDVTTVAIGSGLSYGSLGYSHHALEDLALMRSFKGMTIFTPSSLRMLEHQLKIIMSDHGPKYLRIPKSSCDLREVKIFDNYIYCWKKEENSKNLIIAIGDTIQESIKLSQHLKHSDVVSPLYWNCQKDEVILDFIKSYEKIKVIEDHSYRGGFGSHLLELTSLGRINREIEILGFDDAVKGLVGSDEQLRLKTNFGYSKFMI